MMTKGQQAAFFSGRPLELYIHIPFCVRKCAYCDFLSGPCGPEGQNRYMEALLREIRLFGQDVTEPYQVVSIFFGGGTPSIVEPRWIAGVMEEIRRNFTLSEDAEVTLEANPGTLTAEKLSVYRAAGINRLSVGLQSAEDQELILLGRIHTWADFYKSYELIRRAGFSNVNVDLMSALPGQTLKSWEKTLKRVCALSPEHLSAYSLILEEGTPFYERYGPGGKQEESLPSEEEERAMYALTGQYLRERGYHRYEISNYARTGRECRHNNGYWTGTEYKGFGIGAASYLCRDGRYVRETNLRDRSRYTALLSGEKPAGKSEGLMSGSGNFEKGAALTAEKLPANLVEEQDVLTVEKRMEEFFFLGLRRMEGVWEKDFFCLFQKPVEDVYGPVLKKLQGEGLLERRAGRILLTERGIDVSNQVFVEFLF